MTSHLVATFANGVFTPDEPVDLPENAKVSIRLESVVEPPKTTHPPGSPEAIAEFIRRCKESPLHTGIGWKGRDELYDDRI